MRQQQAQSHRLVNSDQKRLGEATPTTKSLLPRRGQGSCHTFQALPGSMVGRVRNLVPVRPVLPVRVPEQPRLLFCVRCSSGRNSLNPRPRLHLRPDQSRQIHPPGQRAATHNGPISTQNANSDLRHVTMQGKSSTFHGMGSLFFALLALGATFSALAREKMHVKLFGMCNTWRM